MGVILNKLTLENFKCYEKHVIPFRNTTIMVGKNNAGKSTVIEALRILGLACHRLHNSCSFITRPDWLSSIHGIAVKGVNITANAIDVELEHVFNRYGQPPAIIEAEFSSGIIAKIYINNEKEIFIILNDHDKNLKTKSSTLIQNIPNFFVLPQITPLRKEEDFVSWTTIRRNRFSKRSSGNFRTHLYECRENPEYKIFEELLQKTWHGVSVYSMMREDNGIIQLNLRDNDFVTEVYNMGHGVQMWLQMLWFIACAERDAILILDEPDVYMHADLQRKLIRLIKNKYPQTIIATHSIEIISDVQPKDLLLINRSNPQSCFAENHPILQKAIYELGSIHNINLNRILNNNTFLFVEGEDYEILKIFFDTLFPDNPEPLEYYTTISTGGFASWEAEKEKAKKLIETSPEIRIFFLYDRDYFSKETIHERLTDAQKHHINMHIWERKELENYLLNTQVIAKYIVTRKAQQGDFLTIENVRLDLDTKLDELCQEKKMDIFYKHIDQLKKTPNGKRKEFSTLVDEYSPSYESNWNLPEYRLSVVPGKELFSQICEYCQQTFNVCLSQKQIAHTFNQSDIPDEIKSFLSEVAKID